MKTFKINFLDIDGNDIYSKIDTFYDEQDASKYATHKLATTSDECVTFKNKNYERLLKICFSRLFIRLNYRNY